jgi:hypothetical protein
MLPRNLMCNESFLKFLFTILAFSVLITVESDDFTNWRHFSALYVFLEWLNI